MCCKVHMTSRLSIGILIWHLFNIGALLLMMTKFVVDKSNKKFNLRPVVYYFITFLHCMGRLGFPVSFPFENWEQCANAFKIVQFEEGQKEIWVRRWACVCDIYSQWSMHANMKLFEPSVSLQRYHKQMYDSLNLKPIHKLSNKLWNISRIKLSSCNYYVFTRNYQPKHYKDFWCASWWVNSKKLWRCRDTLCSWANHRVHHMLWWEIWKLRNVVLFLR